MTEPFGAAAPPTAQVGSSPARSRVAGEHLWSFVITRGLGSDPGSWPESDRLVFEEATEDLAAFWRGETARLWRVVRKTPREVTCS